MNSTVQYASARSFALSLERRWRSRGFNVPEARRDIARKVRIGIGTFENIIRNRVKRIDERIRDRLQALLIRELEAEMARLSHELEMARQSGAHPASQHIGEIEAHLAAVKILFNGSRSPA